MDAVFASLDLTATEFWLLSGIVMLAGIVRGFSGFAMSAVIMAIAVLILPPVQLIPICWWMEMTASALMVRGGWREADRRVVWILVIGSTVGVPIGLWATTTLPVETSKLIVLILVITLSASQLAKLRLPFLATKPGLYGTGLTAGIVTGLAHIGGMVIALYVLSQNAPAAKMRAALVMFLFLGSLTSLVSQAAFGVMDQTGTLRGLALAIPCALGVAIGQSLFTPRFAAYYRPVCLSLLCVLAGSALIRMQIA